MSEPDETLPEGTLFAGEYRILRLIDQGGMGTVYLAEQVSTGQRRALKLMLDRLANSASMRQRFEQEARVVARIRSAHVVQVIGAGIDEATGYPWIAMEFLEGTSLDRRFPPGHAVNHATAMLIMEQLGHALGAAHTEQIVHRDIKPENIFLSEAHLVGVPFLVKLLDFGIAKVLSEAREGGTMLLGSPCWMAPEQLSGAHPISPATDVWAFGLLAFRLLTGRLYWKSAQSGSEGLLGVFQELGATPVPPSQRARELGVATPLPPGFDAWFLRCVHPDPLARFPSANDALRSLRSLDSGATSPTLPSPPPLPEPTARLQPTEPPPSYTPTPSPLSPLGPPSTPSRPRTIAIRHRQGASADDFLRVYGADLTDEGFFLRTSHPLPLDTPVVLEIYVADGVPIARGSAFVAQLSVHGMYLRFTALSGPLVDALAARSRR